MPERRSLRSNKPDASSSTNGGKASSNPQSSSSSKDKTHPARSTSSRSKSFPNKKGITAAAKETNGDQHRVNGSDAVENVIDGVDDLGADDQQANSTSVKKAGKDKDGDEEMTVVVPPSKASKISGSPKHNQGDTAMNGVDEPESKDTDDAVDPEAKAAESRSHHR